MDLYTSVLESLVKYTFTVIKDKLDNTELPTISKEAPKNRPVRFKTIDTWEESDNGLLIFANTTAVVMNHHIANSPLRPINYKTVQNKSTFWKFKTSTNKTILFWRYIANNGMRVPKLFYGYKTEIWIHATTKNEVMSWIEHFKDVFIHCRGQLIIQMSSSEDNDVHDILLEKIQTQQNWDYYFTTDPHLYGISFIPIIQTPINETNLSL